jgi:Tfp pilus assembly protein PilV
MDGHGMQASRRRHQRGVSLFESLVAFVVLAAGTVAVGPLQTQLRLVADIARERSEAVRLGEEEAEGLRSFAVIAAASGVRSYAAIGNADAVVNAATGYGGHASYRVARRVDDASFSGTKATSVTVRWNDRGGAAHEIAFASFVARSDPRYAGSLALGAGAVPAATRGALGRSPSIPHDAKVVGGGRSAWKPVASGTLALVFDDRTGDVVGRCTGIASTTETRHLTTADLASCASGRWLLLGGTVRFTSAMPPLPDDARETPPDLDIALALTHGSYAALPHCVTEARKGVRYVAAGSLHIDAVPLAAVPASAGVASWQDTGDRFVAWHCVVAPRADGRWSGRASLVARGWSIGAGSGDRRVCRYAADADGSGAVDANIEHPGEYADVPDALMAQNFLVIAGNAVCPGAPAVRLTGQGSTVHADLGTAPHQP